MGEFLSKSNKLSTTLLVTLTHLSANCFNKEEQDMFTASVRSRRKVGVGEQAIEEALSACLIASD